MLTACFCFLKKRGQRQKKKKLLAKSVKNGKGGDEMVDEDHLTTGAVVLLSAPNSESGH